MFRIGLSTCSKTVDEELFREYSVSGIDVMEISLSKEKCEVFDFYFAQKMSEKYGVELWSFHLPFMPFDEIDISLPGLKAFSVSYLSELIKKGAAHGIKRFIIHPSGEPILESEREDRLKTASESLSALARIASTCGCVIAVENLPRTCLGRDSADILRLLEADDTLRVCFDTNHLLRESHEEFVRAAGDKIITTHISDYDFIDEKHWLPGEGKVEWRTIPSMLEKAGYDGVWLYELGFIAPKSMPRSRVLICEDFVRNAKEIFTGSPITRVI